MADKALVLILVYGTWAQHAPWTLNKSRFVETFKEAIPTIGRIIPVEWSGANLFAARLEASKDIIGSLESVQADEEAIICAHSHGGGALCYALNERPDLTNKIKGAIFLGTPFIIFRLLPSWRALLDGLFAPIIFIYIAILAAAAVLIRLAFDLIVKFQIDGFALFLLAMAGISLVAMELSFQGLMKLNRLKITCSRRILERALRRAKLVSCRLPADLHAFFVRVSADEAAVGLNFATALLWPMISINALYGRFFSSIIVPYRQTKIRRPVAERATFYWLAFLILLGLPNIFNLRGAWNISFFGPLVWFAAVVTLGILILASVYLIVSYVMAGINWLISWFFGGTMFLSGALVQPAVEPIPPGLWGLSHVNWGSLRRRDDEPFLRHSRLYSDPEIVSSVIDWTRKILTPVTHTS